MLISVITVNYNDSEGLQKTLESSFAQSCSGEWEQLVIDGGSSDGSQQVISRYADRLAYHVSERDGGIYEGMNKGVAKAQGKYCIFMNAGDTFASDDVLEKVMQHLSTDADFYVGNVLRADWHKGIIRSPKAITASYMLLRSLPHQGMFIRTQLLRNRPYQTQYRIIADWEQQTYELLLNGARYEHLDITIANFDATGISNSNQKASEQERKRATDALFSRCLQESLMGRDKYESRLFYSLSKDTAKARHIAMWLNHIKWVFADLLSR